jgi:hypothetical protein
LEKSHLIFSLPAKCIQPIVVLLMAFIDLNASKSFRVNRALRTVASTPGKKCLAAVLSCSINDSSMPTPRCLFLALLPLAVAMLAGCVQVRRATPETHGAMHLSPQDAVDVLERIVPDDALVYVFTANRLEWHDRLTGKTDFIKYADVDCIEEVNNNDCMTMIKIYSKSSNESHNLGLSFGPKSDSNQRVQLAAEALLALCPNAK